MRAETWIGFLISVMKDFVLFHQLESVAYMPQSDQGVEGNSSMDICRAFIHLTNDLKSKLFTLGSRKSAFWEKVKDGKGEGKEQPLVLKLLCHLKPKAKNRSWRLCRSVSTRVFHGTPGCSGTHCPATAIDTNLDRLSQTHGGIILTLVLILRKCDWIVRLSSLQRAA